MVTVFVLGVVYVFVGMFVGKWYWQRRHGVYKQVFGGGADALFSAVFPISIVWPVLFLFPGFRNPELCRHPSHILERDQNRAQLEQFQAAAERDEQYRRR